MEILRGILFDARDSFTRAEKRRNEIQPFVYIRFPERPGFFMPLMSTAADPLGPAYPAPCRGRSPAVGRGVMFSEGYPVGRPRALSGGAVFSALKPIAGGAAFILGSHLAAAAG